MQVVPSAGTDGLLTGNIDISLHHLLHHCQVLAPLRKFPQTLLVKHLKSHLADTLDLRMAVAEPKPWFNRAGEASSQQLGSGGYEVRLKAPSIAVLSKLDWAKRMVYVVSSSQASHAKTY